MQVSQAANPRSHLRTKSTSTMPGARDASAERVQKGRPRSLLVPPGSAARAGSNSSADLGVRDSSTSVRNADALKRTTSTRVKSAASDINESGETTQIFSSAQQGLPVSSRRCEPTQDEQRKLSRPAFSTLQQHFTPRKTGKAPTSTFLHPPSVDAGISSISSEVSSIQSELLQLHLLHRSFAETNRQWESSAERIMRARFDEVASMYQVMREQERKTQEQKNIQALREWGGSDSAFALAEQIHILSEPLHELPSLIDPNGRFRHLAAEFDRWIAWVEDVWAARKKGATRDDSDLKSADGLGDAWKAETASMTRRLTTSLRNLNRLTEPAPGSSIACIVSTSKQALHGFLEELHAMQAIEADIVHQEKAWVETRLRAIAQDIGSYLVTPVDDEAWRR